MFWCRNKKINFGVGKGQALILIIIYCKYRSFIETTYCYELCMYYISAKQNNDTDPWSTILAFLQFPELGLTEFFNACIQEGSYLLLHCYVLQRVPLCQSLVEEQGVIEIILDWTERVKPT